MIGLIIKLTVSLFAVMNPLGNIPIFISLTQDYTNEERKAAARKATLISFIILTIFLLVGKIIFSTFGITIHGFRVAGGILIFGIAYGLLHAKPTGAQHPQGKDRAEAQQKDDISVTPLALPIIAGPGTIATVMSHSTNTASQMIGVGLSYTIILAVTFILFNYSFIIMKRLGRNGLNVISRLMGLILAVMAIQMIAEGIQGLFPALFH